MNHAPANSKDRAPECKVVATRRLGSNGLQSVRRATAVATALPGVGWLQQRLQHAARHHCQRGAGSTGGGPPGVTGSWLLKPQRAERAALPNPSLKRSTNGGTPSPGWWYAVHFHQPGLGVPPLVPA